MSDTTDDDSSNADDKQNKIFIMLRFFMLCMVMSTLFINNVFAQTNSYTDIYLWPNGAPNSNGTEGQTEDDKKGIFKPQMRVYLPDAGKSTGRAVIALPGGGYSHLAYNHEGYDFAKFFTDQGIAFIVLKYRMPFGNKDVPFSDVIEAIRITKTNAAKWFINENKIGIMGSSAGGHLAATIATKSEAATKPAFQILLYPVITMDSTYTHKGSRRNLLGANPTNEISVAYSNEKQVTATTPKAFIAFSDDDKVVLPTNGTNYYNALHKAGVSASLHIYPSGGHGWGFRDAFKYKDAFLKDLKDWLNSFE